MFPRFGCGKTPPLLDTAGALDLRNALIDLRVVVADSHLDLRPLGAREDAHHDAGGRNRRDALGDLLGDVLLLALEHPDVALSHTAIDRLIETFHGLLFLHCAASGEREDGEATGDNRHAVGPCHDWLLVLSRLNRRHHRLPPHGLLTVRRSMASALSESVHRVATSRHAGGEGPVVVVAPLGEGVLSLGHVALLLLPLLLLHLLLLFHVSAASHHAEETSHTGPDGRALAGVATDGAADGPEGRSAHGSPEQSALRSLRLRIVRRRRGWPSHPGIRRVEASLLDGPAVTLSLVGLFLLRRLAARRIDVESLGPSLLRQRKEHHDAQQQP